MEADSGSRAFYNQELRLHREVSPCFQQHLVVSWTRPQEKDEFSDAHMSAQPGA